MSRSLAYEIGKRVKELSQDCTTLDLSKLQMSRWPKIEQKDMSHKTSDIQELNLSHNELDGSAIDEILQRPEFRHLKSLNIANNPIAESLSCLPKNRLKQLTRLNLSNIDLHHAIEPLLGVLASASNLRELSLGNCNLGSVDLEVLGEALPEAITDLTLSANKITAAEFGDLLRGSKLAELRSLNLFNNKLNAEGAQLLADHPAFTNLTRLNIDTNAIGSEGFKALTGSRSLDSLTHLSVSANLIGEGAFESISKERAGSLVELEIDSNSINDDVIEYFAERGFVSLEKLSIGDSNVTERSLAQLLQASSFPKLRCLIAFHCMITELPQNGDYSNLDRLALGENKIRSIPASFANTKKGMEIDLEGNRFENDPPKSIVAAGRDAIVDYLNRASNGFTEDRLARVLILGKYEVGKTTLARKLLNPTYRPEPIPRTMGIDRSTWDVRSGGKKFAIELWDFGGQELQYHCHQWFINPESSYLLVIDAGTSDEELESQVRLLSELSRSDVQTAVKVLPVLNRNRVKYPDEAPLWYNRVKNYSNLDIEESIEIDLDLSSSDATVKALSNRIRDFGLSSLPQGLVKDYSEIRDALFSLAEPMKSYADFCKYVESQLTFEEATTEDERETSVENAIRYLEYLGSLRVFTQSNLVVLNMSWLLKAIYKVFDPEPDPENRIVSDDGYFSKKELLNCSLWRELCAKKWDRENLFEILCAGQTDLVFSPNPDDRDLYFVPAYLSAIDEIPEEIFTNSSHRIVVCRFDHTPLGLFERLIVRLNDKIVRFEGDLSHWSNYLVADIDGERCHICKVENEIKIIYSPTAVKPTSGVEYVWQILSEFYAIYRNISSIKLYVGCHYCMQKQQSFPVGYFGEYYDMQAADAVGRCSNCFRESNASDMFAGSTESTLGLNKRTGGEGSESEDLLLNITSDQLLRFIFRVAAFKRGYTPASINDIPLFSRKNDKLRRISLAEKITRDLWSSQCGFRGPTKIKVYPVTLVMLCEENYFQSELASLRILRKNNPGLDFGNWKEGYVASEPDSKFLKVARELLKDFLEEEGRIIPYYIRSTRGRQIHEWIVDSDAAQAAIKKRRIDMTDLSDVEIKLIHKDQ